MSSAIPIEDENGIDLPSNGGKNVGKGNRIVLPQDEEVGQRLFQPTARTSFYGKAPASASYLLLKKHQKMRNGEEGNAHAARKRKRHVVVVPKSKRQFEIFKEERKKDIVVTCPTLLEEFDQRVFNEAAKEMWSQLSDVEKGEFREMAAAERRQVESETPQTEEEEEQQQEEEGVTASRRGAARGGKKLKHTRKIRRNNSAERHQAGHGKTSQNAARGEGQRKSARISRSGLNVPGMLREPSNDVLLEHKGDGPVQGTTQ